MTIDLCFKGWLREADITHVTDFSDPKAGMRKLVVEASKSSPGQVDLRGDEYTPPQSYLQTITRAEFIARLNDGRYAVSLSEMLQADNRSEEIEIFDFDLNT